MTTARYLLCPGLVLSRSDGDWHEVSAGRLAALYGVPLSECLVAYEPRPGLRLGRATYNDLMARVDSGELVALRPRHDGDYRLP